MSQKFTMLLTSAVAIAGEVHSAGSVVRVDKATAENLLYRGKAEVQADTAEADEAEADEQEQPEATAEVQADAAEAKATKRGTKAAK